MKRLETRRLILRNFTMEDARQIHPLFCLDETMRLVGMYPPYTELAQTQKRIDRWRQSDGRLAITLRETGAVIGYIAISPAEDEEGAEELGFAVLPACRRMGYMSEAVLAVLADRQRSGVRAVWACCFQENEASARLIRSLGFRFQGTGVYDAPNDGKHDTLRFRMDLSL